MQNHETKNVCLAENDYQNREVARLHLIDLDNLHRTPNPSNRAIDHVRKQYEVIGFGQSDLIYAACNHAPRKRACEEHRRTYHLRATWPKATFRLGQGVDGADLHLLEDAETFFNQPNQRFNEVILGTGDHIFAPTAKKFKENGLIVHAVVATEKSLARKLRQEINGCIWNLTAGRCMTCQPYSTKNTVYRQYV